MPPAGSRSRSRGRTSEHDPQRLAYRTPRPKPTEKAETASKLPSPEGNATDADGRSAPGSSNGIQEGSPNVTPAVSPPGATMPSVPAMPIPECTKVVLTVPVKMKVSPQATLQDVRQKLLAAGIPVETSKGAFHCRGDSEAADQSLVRDLKDTRLVFFPEPDLVPWQLCAAHRACEQLVRQCLGQNWAAASRHPFYKTRLCNNFVQQGGCLRGDRCVYAHGPGELRRSTVPPGFIPRPMAPPGGQPSPLGHEGAKSPPPKVPEVVFTVDKEEERRRAERAKRFAPRAASFEAKEAPPQTEKDESPEEPDIDEVDPEVGLLNEEQIAEYLMEMQQQFLPTDSADGGFDMDLGDFQDGQGACQQDASEPANQPESQPIAHGDTGERSFQLFGLFNYFESNDFYFSFTMIPIPLCPAISAPSKPSVFQASPQPSALKCQHFAPMGMMVFMAVGRTACRAEGEGERRRKRRVKYSPFCTKTTQWRGQTGRGKKGHFHLLDRYIRRIDALLPEDMEDLVRPMSYKPNQEQTTRSIKITFPDDMVAPDDISEQEVRSFLAPTVPRSIALGWRSEEGNAEVFVLFDDNDDCRTARQLDGQRLGERFAQVRFTVDNKFRRVMEDLGFWEKGGNQLDGPVKNVEEQSQPVEQEAALPADA